MKKLYYILYIICIPLFLAACQKDENAYINWGRLSTSEVSFSFTVPAPMIPETRAEADEVLKSVHILMFEPKDNTLNATLLLKEYAVVASEEIKGEGSNTNPYVFKKKFGKSEKCQFVLVANPPAAVVSAFQSAAASATEADRAKTAIFDKTKAAMQVNSGTLFNYSTTAQASGLKTQIPMYGETDVTQKVYENPNLSTTQNKYAVELYRMTARVTVDAKAVTVASPITDFKLEEVYLCNAYTTGILSPLLDGTTQNATLPVTDTHLPVTQTVLSAHAAFTVTNNAAENIYLFENDATVPKENDDIETEPNRAQSSYLVIKTTYKLNGTAEIGYFPIDFTKETGEAYAPILRNHKYIVTIKEVKGAGYKELSEAKKAYTVPSNNLGFRVLSYDEGKVNNILHDGQYYLGVSDLQLDPMETDANVQLQSNFNGKWTIEQIDFYDGPNPSATPSVTKPAANTVYNNWFKLDAVTGSWEGADGKYAKTFNAQFTSTNNSEKHSDVLEDRIAILHVRSGRLTAQIKVVQKFKPFIRIYTGEYKGANVDNATITEIDSLDFMARRDGIAPKVAEKKITVVWGPKSATLKSENKRLMNYYFSTTGDYRFSFSKFEVDRFQDGDNENAPILTSGVGYNTYYLYPKRLPYALDAKKTVNIFLTNKSNLSFSLNEYMEMDSKGVILYFWRPLIIVYNNINLLPLKARAADGKDKEDEAATIVIYSNINWLSKADINDEEMEKSLSIFPTSTIRWTINHGRRVTIDASTNSEVIGKTDETDIELSQKTFGNILLRNFSLNKTNVRSSHIIYYYQFFHPKSGDENLGEYIRKMDFYVPYVTFIVGDTYQYKGKISSFIDPSYSNLVDAAGKNDLYDRFIPRFISCGTNMEAVKMQGPGNKEIRTHIAEYVTPYRRLILSCANDSPETYSFTCWTAENLGATDENPRGTLYTYTQDGQDMELLQACGSNDGTYEEVNKQGKWRTPWITNTGLMDNDDLRRTFFRGFAVSTDYESPPEPDSWSAERKEAFDKLWYQDIGRNPDEMPSGSLGWNWVPASSTPLYAPLDPRTLGLYGYDYKRNWPLLYSYTNDLRTYKDVYYLDVFNKSEFFGNQLYMRCVRKRVIMLGGADYANLIERHYQSDGVLPIYNVK